MFVTAVLGAGPTRLFTDSDSSNTGMSTYSFTVDTGREDATRYIVVDASGFHSLTATTLNSITIGGSGATIHRSEKSTRAPNSANAMSAIAGLALPSGTSTTVTVVFSTTIFACGVAIYALYDLVSTTPFAANGNTADTTTSVSTTLNIPGGGIGIATCTSYNIITGPASLTGLTQDFDITVSPGGTDQFEQNGGSSENMSAETGRTITATGTGTLPRSICAVSWA